MPKNSTSQKKEKTNKDSTSAVLKRLRRLDFELFHNGLYINEFAKRVSVGVTAKTVRRDLKLLEEMHLETLLREKPELFGAGKRKPDVFRITDPETREVNPKPGVKREWRYNRFWVKPLFTCNAPIARVSTTVGKKPGPKSGTG